MTKPLFEEKTWKDTLRLATQQTHTAAAQAEQKLDPSPSANTPATPMLPPDIVSPS